MKFGSTGDGLGWFVMLWNFFLVFFFTLSIGYQLKLMVKCVFFCLGKVCLGCSLLFDIFCLRIIISF